MRLSGRRSIQHKFIEGHASALKQAMNNRHMNTSIYNLIQSSPAFILELLEGKSRIRLWLLSKADPYRSIR